MKPDQNSLQGKAAPDELRFIRLREVLAICGKSRSSIYDAIKDGEFPAPVNVGGRSTAWVKSEVLQWAQACIDSSRPNDVPKLLTNKASRDGPKRPSAVVRLQSWRP